jgi:5-methylcytosine-specific restriction endonuclease McrA
MATKKTESDTDRHDRLVAEGRRYQDQKEKGYRAQALKIYPWICAHCTREFSGETLRELTVHHKDHNHDNNPPDGSNWELLCIYCHENEHSRQEVGDAYGEATPDRQQVSSTYKPFADLENLLKRTE